MKIVILDANRTNPGDLSWDDIRQLGELTVYGKSSTAEVIERSQFAEVILTNKVKFKAAQLDQLPQLKLICLLATGYDNIDIEAARARNICVCNAVGYSTESVAQHVIALLLSRNNAVAQHNNWVQSGGWSKAEWSHTLSTIHEVSGKVMGIYGFGKIGQRVAVLAQALGMKIIAHHKHPDRDAQPGVTFVSMNELFEQSDVITLHAPLTAANKGIVGESLLTKMKPTTLLINTGRGGLIDEPELRDYLITHPDAAAAVDVLSMEPPPADHPLFGLKNCVITPHNAWASYEARERLIKIVADNVAAFISGNPQNVVNP